MKFINIFEKLFYTLRFSKISKDYLKINTSMGQSQIWNFPEQTETLL